MKNGGALGTTVYANEEVAMEVEVVGSEEEEGLINIRHMGKVDLDVARVSLEMGSQFLDRVRRMSRAGLQVVS